MKRLDSRFSNELNFRDLGGYISEDGRRVKYGIFYRGSSLDFYNDDELAEIKKLNLKTIMDIRSPFETNKYPDPEIDGVNHIEESGTENDIDWSPEGMSKVGKEGEDQVNQIIEHYKEIAFNNKAYKIMMNEIKNDQVPIYIHCAVGKDRTGVAVIILLLALGIKQEEIRRDYLLSNEYRKEILKKELVKISHKVDEYPESAILTTILYGVYESIYDVIIDSILDKYDSFDEYIMEEHDFSREELSEFRDKYLEK